MDEEHMTDEVGWLGMLCLHNVVSLIEEEAS